MTSPTVVRSGSCARRAVRSLLLVALLSAVAMGRVAPAHAAPGDPCAAPVDVIACENTKPGSPSSEWQVSGAGDPSIQGFATQMSVDAGEQIDFKVKTPATAYKIDIYRVGYYGGDGARYIDTVNPSAALPQTQPPCLKDVTSGLVDCGDWAVSASWDVPSDAVSGVYVAHLVRLDTGGDSQIVFVVRDDVSHSQILYQTSDETWQAYNSYGGTSLYAFNSNASWWSGRAYKVSYNRPLITREDQPANTFWGSEYPMVRWLERNGYDVSYSSEVDTAFPAAHLTHHQMWMSSGHDEYWSAEQRANVEAARDAGVNVSFFSGNEMFWKTRWEPSIDGNATPARTIVCYKETNSSTRLDPSGIWTGTWRDARFSPPADGGRPENAVTGTLYMVNSRRSDSIVVPAADGRLRFWRNTGIDQLASGDSATLPAGVLGYEWDEDEDNGFRPPGLIDLSHTTIDIATQYLLDAGVTYGAGTATHSLTLHRVASGAYVFGAGTIQWSWGLDVHHDQDGPVDPDPRMRQATVNLFADMGVQPSTLQAGLVAATASTDATAPTTTISTEAPSRPYARNDIVTIAGTAADAGGGVVGGVEVSTDGGSTWHRATGRESWHYDWHVSGFGPVRIEARAVDDSGNLGDAVTLDVTVGCPCTVWSDTAKPVSPSADDSQSYELGLKFRTSVAGYVRGVRFYKGAGNNGPHRGRLWTASGTELADVLFTDETASGWQTAQFARPVPVDAGTTYVISYYAPSGHYALDRPGLVSAVLSPPLKALADGEDGPNAVFKSGAGGFPTQTKNASNYWVDVLFDQDGTDRVAPSVAWTTPAAGDTSASVDNDVVARFDEPLDPASVTGATARLLTAGGDVVPATVSYDAASNGVVIHPSARLARGASYTAVVSGGAGGVQDPSGNALASDAGWSFTTYACPCSLWPDTTTPANPSWADDQSYELGVKFRSSIGGYVTGIRFYKGPGNTGTHLGHLWTSTGTRLGEVTFTNESATGWQVARFGAPIAIQPSTTYVASYYAPVGRYALDRPSQLASGLGRGPLWALADGEEGANGVFKAGASGFPGQAKTGTASNYWVTPVFDEDGTDRVAPSVRSTTPAFGAASVVGSTNVVVQFDEPVSPASVSGSTVALYDPSGNRVPATVTYDGLSATATLDPTADLRPATTYRAVVTGGASGVTDLTGNALADDVSWTFTTYACPCSIWSASATPGTPAFSDTGAYELGLKFRSTVDGVVTGVRFYKGTGNGGVHVGHLWNATGTKLAEATFSNETATGWQSVTFPTPVQVQAGKTYVASYWAPQGRYALDRPSVLTTGLSTGPLRALADGEEGSNGVFRSGTSAFPNQAKALTASNYWVDVIFNTLP